MNAPQTYSESLSSAPQSTPTETISVLIVDEQPLVRAGVRVLLESGTGIEVVGEASAGHQALQAIAELRPEVVVLEVRVSTGDGIRTLALIAASPSRPRALVLTNVEAPQCVADCLRAGARGYVLKRSSPQRILEAVAAVHAGELPIDPAVAARLMDVALPHLVGGDQGRPVCELSQREGQIVRLLSDGLDTSEIALRLHVSRSTVKTHVSNVLSKWKLRDRVQLVARAHESGYLRRKA